MILGLLDEAEAAGARLERACEVLGVEPRTVQRWRLRGGGEDGRHGPKGTPTNALSAAERAEVLAVANAPEHRDLSPKQIVPQLADRGQYVASESTFYRVLRAQGQLAHRGRARPPRPRPAPSHVATAPNRIWVWDITYLPTAVRGVFFYLYLMVDLFSRKVVGWRVHEAESMELSSELLEASLRAEGVDGTGLVVHADNGGPMKGSTMLATMQRLGVVPSFSRPSVSDDNAFAEAFFRHLKYAPSYPRTPFASLAEARRWVERFVRWYNEEHRHSGIQFVTPSERHRGEDGAVLAARQAVYERARRRHPERWSGPVRDCDPAGEVALVGGRATKESGRGATTAPSSSEPAGVRSSRRRRRPPLAREARPRRAQGGSRAAEPARSAREPLTHPSPSGALTSRGASAPSSASIEPKQGHV
jgi:transposase InsO family protein